MKKEESLRKSNLALYSHIHYWLNRNYGKANHCDFCKNPSKRYDWALKKGYNYEKNRNNYFQLCKKCHANYDMTDEFRRNLSESRKKLFTTEEGIVLKNKMRIARNNFLESKEGKVWKNEQSKIISKYSRSSLPEVRKKMSISHKLFFSSEKGDKLKEKQAINQKNNWDNLEYKKKNIEGRKLYWESPAGLLRKQKMKKNIISKNHDRKTTT